MPPLQTVEVAVSNVKLNVVSFGPSNPGASTIWLGTVLGAGGAATHQLTYQTVLVTHGGAEGDALGAGLEDGEALGDAEAEGDEVGEVVGQDVADAVGEGSGEPSRLGSKRLRLIVIQNCVPEPLQFGFSCKSCGA